ncbi:glycerophosphoryl diester phosphodiesterase [Xanthomonas sp. GW]|uniref:glycerophosphodiester phosphodiesterase n=1 Tax=Xanthomonas sp. GW TaxID=2724121 RepID=UPI0018619F05|nr:glycerophosphodiester phosphodiesterase [Xanthomonas sp. GW]QNH22942.1 glycerophosphoryl diester phosphodiesterase [Xanthomonas sp. GW]
MMKPMVWMLGCSMALSSLTAAADTVAAAGTHKPLVIGHRGASALRPEHTLASYAKAIADGADFIEPDLVSTKDGALVARHENEIGATTDVAAHPEFAARKTAKQIDGQRVEGWFTEDFTLAELKTLRARERLPQLRSTAFDGQFQLLTFDEIIDFAAAEAAARGRTIGLIPEIKHGTYFQALGLAMEDKVLTTLDAHAYTRSAPVIVQSFEIGNLQSLHRKLGKDHQNVRLVQLLGDPKERPGDQLRDGPTYAQMGSAQGLRAIAEYAQLVSPNLRTIIPVDADGALAAPTAFIADAHAAGLQVVPYTFRPENYFLPKRLQDARGPAAVNADGSIAEMRAFIAAGVDAFFTDDPALGRAAVDGTAPPQER